MDKELWTENADGADVQFYAARTDGEEADFVVKNIITLKKSTGCRYSDFAVLMRINSLSRTFEEKLIQYGIPHKVYGGSKGPYFLSENSR